MAATRDALANGKDSPEGRIAMEWLIPAALTGVIILLLIRLHRISRRESRRRMDCFSTEARQVFRQWNKSDLCKDLEDVHEKLRGRRIAAIKYGDPAKLSANERTRLNCELMRQALLHRAERLLVSSGTMLLEKNVYGLALIVRGHLEGTAVLGYLCDRLKSVAAGNIPFEKFEWDVADAVMGAKHDVFSEANPPPNILTSIEKADRFLDDDYFEEKRQILQDAYNWLSEFAHPNYLSNSSAFKLDKPTQSFVFRHDSDLQESDFEVVSYLWVSAELFVILFDRLEKQADEVLAA